MFLYVQLAEIAKRYSNNRESFREASSEGDEKKCEELDLEVSSIKKEISKLIDRYPSPIKFDLNFEMSSDSELTINVGSPFQDTISFSPSFTKGIRFSRGAVRSEDKQEEAKQLIRKILSYLKSELKNVHTGSPIDSKLSSREFEIVNLMASGLKPSEIASKLGISLHTVRNHMKSAYKKLEVNSQIELISKLKQ